MIGLLVLLFIGIILASGNRPKEIDWTPTYSIHDKIPFGLYVLDHEIGNFVSTDIKKLEETPYEFLDSIWDYEGNTYKLKGNIFNVSADQNLDQESLKEIFYFVSHGNSAFLSMESFPRIFADSLNVKIDAKFQYKDTVKLALDNPGFKKKKYAMAEGVNPIYFSSIDTLNTTILGHFENDSLRPNFIKVNFRGGVFYLHTVPAAFTNVHLLKADHSDYAAKILSYMPQTQTYWYIGKDTGSIGNSKLRFIFRQDALKWAWLILLFGLLGFMVFNARRKQRVVPILEPLPNTTVDFAKTIGNLYYQEGDHHTVIDRKIVYFLEKIRNEYLIDTTRLDEAFISKFHQKSGKDEESIKDAVRLINEHRRSPHTAVEEDLIKINTALEKLL